MLTKNDGQSFIGGKKTKTTSEPGGSAIMHCFPLYSILLAVGNVNIDYFSLDIEGHELAVLKTIPFHKTNIEVTINIHENQK